MSYPTSDEFGRELFTNLEEATGAARADVMQATLPLLRLLMKGEPVELDHLTERADLPRDRLDLMLDRLGAERDDNGRITGLALSLTPTPHRYEAEGRVLYGWCALDTFVPAVLEHTGRITSSDPISGETIHLTISPERIEHVDPPTARVALVHAGDTSNMRETFCRPGRFFAREETARRWASRREGVDVVPAAEAYAAAQEIAERIRSWTARS